MTNPPIEILKARAWAGDGEGVASGLAQLVQALPPRDAAAAIIHLAEILAARGAGEPVRETLGGVIEAVGRAGENLLLLRGLLAAARIQAGGDAAARSEVDGLLATATQVANTIGDTTARHVVATARAEWALLRGYAQEARALLAPVLNDTTPPPAALMVGAATAAAAGDWNALKQTLERVPPDAGGPAWSLFRGILARANGANDTARGHLTAAANSPDPAARRWALEAMLLLAELEPEGGWLTRASQVSDAPEVQARVVLARARRGGQTTAQADVMALPPSLERDLLLAQLAPGDDQRREAVLDVLERARARGLTGLQAEAHALLATAGPLPHRATHLRAAQALYTDLGDRAGLVHIRLLRGRLEQALGELPAAMAAAQAAAEAGRSLGRPDLVAQAAQLLQELQPTQPDS